MKKEIMMDPQLAMQEAESFTRCEYCWTEVDLSGNSTLNSLTRQLRDAYMYGEKEEAEDLESDIHEYVNESILLYEQE